MTTTQLISASEYLRTSFEHDAEFVDGRIEERAAGELDHGKLQRKLLLLLSDLAFEHELLCVPEVRVQTSASRFRVPDLCVLASSAPQEQVVTTPPLLCIEILSPEDTMHRTLARVRDFHAMGVPEVWVVDPESRTVQVCVPSAMTEVATGMLRVPRTSAAVLVEAVFSALLPAR